MRSSRQDLERRRQEIIERIACEREEIFALSAQVVAPVNGFYRLEGRLRRAFALASRVVSMALPVAAFLFRTQPAVQRVGQAMMLLRAARALGRQRAQPPLP